MIRCFNSFFNKVAAVFPAATVVRPMPKQRGQPTHGTWKRQGPNQWAQKPPTLN